MIHSDTKKGFLSSSDLRNRLKFAKKMLKNYSSPVWTNETNFYLDGTSFQHKFYPKDQARGPHRRECWHPSEGFKKDCTWKGAQLGIGGRVAHFIVAILYKSGSVACHEHERTNGKFFTDFVKNKFQKSLENVDEDRSQNRKAGWKVNESYVVKQVSIPARSPDINSIEGFFNFMSSKLQ